MIFRRKSGRRPKFRKTVGLNGGYQYMYTINRVRVVLSKPRDDA